LRSVATRQDEFAIDSLTAALSADVNLERSREDSLNHSAIGGADYAHLGMDHSNNAIQIRSIRNNSEPVSLLALTWAFISGKQVVDIGCGDFEVGRRLYNLAQRYVACDIARPLISYNQKRFKAANLEFRVLDAVEEPLPERAGARSGASAPIATSSSMRFLCFGAIDEMTGVVTIASGMI
jgi:hypothetical protein